MHEASLIQDLMRKIDTLAETENAERLTTVRVRLGALAQLSAAHFREHFALASKGTRAEGAALEISRERGRAIRTY